MDNYIDDRTIDNQEALEELTWAIEASEGGFHIMLARCNYAYLQERLIQQVQEQCALAIRVIHLKQSDRTLYSTICAQLGQEKPAALMVSGLATVDNLDDMLRATNQVREEFRKNFHFPVILWINDAVHVKFLRIAPDFESWTTTTRFAIPTDELIEVLQQNVESLFATALAVNSSQSLYKLTDVLAQGRLSRSELDLALKELPHRVQDLDPQLEAGLQFIRGLNVGDSPEALDYFQQSLTFWQQVGAGFTANLSAQTDNLTKPAPIDTNGGEIDNKIQPNPINAKLKAGLALFHIGLYHYRRTDRKKHQDVNWQTSKINLQHCLDLFDQENRPDLVAKCITQLERVLQRMQAWDELEQVAKKALPLHQQYGSTSKLAQDYSFLAEVALQQQRWDDASQAAQQAENIISQLPKHKQWIQGLNLLFLAQAERQLGNKQAAISHLVKARKLGDFGHPLVYVRILEALRDLYFEDKQYLAAFATKQQRRSIEQQYGIRAFIGAGRLQPHREDASYWSRDLENLSPNLSPARREALSSPSLKNQQEASAKTDNHESVAPEIVASGRQRDLERLLERIGRNDCKLIIIHGRSGVGKSSLVNAGLVPALKQRVIGTQKNVPIAIRVYTNWIEELEKQLVNENEPVGAGLDDNLSGKPPTSQQNPPDSLGLDNNLSEKSPNPQHNQPYANILEQLRQDEQHQRRTVLIFDQFEEFFFVYTNPAERRLFWQFLADCLNILSVKVILSLREDYLHYLLECNRLDSMSVIGHDILGKNVLYELGNFSLTDARAIIEDLTTRSRFYLEPALIDQLVKDLAGTTGEILPIELQVVGAQLQAENIKTLAEYRKLGTKEELVKRYLEEVVEDCGAENQQAAELVLYLLTDEKGTRPLKTRAELERDLEGLAADLIREAGKLDLVLRIFVDSGLVFLLPETPYDRYQLVHDYLAEFIRKQQESRLNELIAELKQEKSQRKLTEEELKRTEQAKQILAAANQKAKRRVQVGSAILLAAVVALIGAVRVVGEVQAQRKEAVSQADFAKHEATQAKEELNITNQQAKAANQNLIVAQDKIRATNQQLQQAQQRVVQAEKIKREAEVKTRQANLNLKATQEKLATANQQLQQAQRQVKQAKAERAQIDKRAKQELQAVIQKMEAAKEQVETARRAADEAKLLQQQLEAESENARKDLAQRVAELDELNINLSQAQTQLNFLDRVQADLSASIQETLINIEQQTQQKSAVIYVTLGTKEDDKLALWLVTSEGSWWKQVPEAVSEEVKNIAKTFIDSVSSREKNDKYRDSSQQLYQWIIAPIEKELNKQNINNLVFLIDSPIPTIPLAALHDGKKFLVEKYSIGLMPGLTLTDNRHLDIKNASVLAMGISNLVTWPQPAVPVELSIIRDIWSGQVTTFLNEEVTINNLKVQRKKKPYQIIHIATVGEFKSGNPEEQYLQLWDNKLQLNQLEQVGWYTPPVELLVLSTSPSGVSDERTKYGFAGLAVQAGVKSVLGTLWYNLEVSHLVLMAEFYHHLQTTPIKAEALRQSQLAMLRGQVRIEEDQLRTSTMSIPLPPELYQPKEKDFSHPYYWSGFTLIGNPW